MITVDQASFQEAGLEVKTLGVSTPPEDTAQATKNGLEDVEIAAEPPSPEKADSEVTLLDDPDTSNGDVQATSQNVNENNIMGVEPTVPEQTDSKVELLNHPNTSNDDVPATSQHSEGNNIIAVEPTVPEQVSIVVSSPEISPPDSDSDVSYYDGEASDGEESESTAVGISSPVETQLAPLGVESLTRGETILEITAVDNTTANGISKSGTVGTKTNFKLIPSEEFKPKKTSIDQSSNANVGPMSPVEGNDIAVAPTISELWVGNLAQVVTSKDLGEFLEGFEV